LPLILGFDRFDPYPTHGQYFGAVVGRYANRIAAGAFTHRDHSYQLDRNEAGRTTLHGGADGFDRRIWHVIAQDQTSVMLSLTSPDGDQGFPGTLQATCTYAIRDHTSLEVRFCATTDKPTPVNLAQHAYFNLDGGPDTTDHMLQIFADAITPAGPDQIPTGQIAPVDGTPFDFRMPRNLRHPGHDFDHNFVLSARQGLRDAARLTSTRSGISMLVRTTKPGLQFYDGHLVRADAPGHGGRRYGAKSGLCLEAQFFPDSPNQPTFPDSILSPGVVYDHRTVFSFTAS
jgi:aldose 1-epimerase